MHRIQEGLLKLSEDHKVAEMKLADLARLLGVEHLQQIKHHRIQLQKRGLLALAEDSKKITKESLGGNARLIRIPVLGSANAGPASIYADGQVQGYLRVSTSLLPRSAPEKPLYALKVVGRSMNLAKIGIEKLSADDGDYVIADSSPYQPTNNDYVVTVVEGRANIKKLLIDNAGRRLALISESTDEFPPILLGVDESSESLVQSKILHVVKPPKQFA